MSFKHKHLFWLLALLVAFSFDLMFWEKPGGINFFIFILLAVLGGLIPLWLEKVPVPWASYILLAPTVFFSLMTLFRAEPLTNTMNGLITLGALSLFFITLRNGAWAELNLWDHLVRFFKFAVNSITGGVLFFSKVQKDLPAPPEESEPVSVINDTQPSVKASAPSRKFTPYLRGILLALPILAILTALLAAADPVFASRLQNLLAGLAVENLGETLFRLAYILILAYVLLSAYFFGLAESPKWHKGQHAQPLLKPFLGSIEAGVVLGAVNLLFLLFVILQFTYLFGGTENITAEGFTYAEYARRGFFELLAVALISLVLFYVLSLWTKRETPAQRKVFSALGLLLVGLVGVILASAYARLTLYEAAYGFTRLRTLTHIFMIWTGLLLLVTAVLEIRQNINRLAFLLILFIFGFGLTVNLLNIDRFIVQQNVTRALEVTDEETETALDASYLAALSYDSIPPLVDYFNDPSLPEPIHASIGGVLACRLASLDQTQHAPLTSYHASRARATWLLQEQSNALGDYPLMEEDGWFSIEINGELLYCNPN